MEGVIWWTWKVVCERTQQMRGACCTARVYLKVGDPWMMHAEPHQNSQLLSSQSKLGWLTSKCEPRCCVHSGGNIESDFSSVFALRFDHNNEHSILTLWHGQCALLDSTFKEYFMVRIDDFGHIMAIEYANNVQQQECSGRQVDIFQCANNSKHVIWMHSSSHSFTLFSCSYPRRSNSGQKLW